MMGMFYPRRTDGIYALQFCGAQVDAQEIARLLRVPVHHIISEKSRTGDLGGALLIPDWSEVPVLSGQWVVISQDREVLQVLDGDDFHKSYSGDGK